ncbi:MAG: hypothetical protein ABI333_24765 [bacterium]
MRAVPLLVLSVVLSVVPSVVLSVALPAHARPRPRLATKPAKPANRSAAKVVTILGNITRTLKSTRYHHATRVSPKRGVYDWDCSGMVDWILRRSAPRAQRAMRSGRPLARDYYNVILGSPTGKARRGWQRLHGPRDARPGDLFAWLKPPHWRRKTTGHVGFLLSRPRRHRVWARIWLMKVADASRYRHENDSRPAGGPGGFGTGTIAFLVDTQGAPLAYGWYGSPQPPNTFVRTQIVFGRVTN